MNLIEPRVVLSVRTGDSQLAKRELVWGKAIPPFSVGTAGQWAIRAAAVDEVHLFLAFDGYRLHAAAASAAHGVSVDGVALGSDWTHVAVPSLLAFGAASIAVDCEDAGHRVTAPVRPQPIIDLSRPDRQTTQLMDLSHTLRMDTVRLEVSEQLLAEWRAAPTAESAPHRVAAQVADAPSLQSGDTLTRGMEGTRRIRLVRWIT